jgi:response regulator of citrate/malate metabolism
MEKLNCALLIDNNISSIFSSYRYLKKMKEIQTIQIENTALAGIQFLQYFLYTNKRLPELIILNLDLPSNEGIQILGIIKEFVAYNSSPVKIIATRNRELTEEINEGDKNYLITYLAKDRLLNYLSKITQRPVINFQ